MASHEVVVNTIAATRTRTGLRVHAALDTGSYPIGVRVSKASMAALPIQCHQIHSRWNYTLYPSGPAEPTGAQSAAPDPATARQAALGMLADPRLTGLPRPELDALTTALAPAQAAHTEQRCYTQRGGRRRHAPGGGTKPLLGDTARIVITLIYLRQICTQAVLS